MEQITGKSCVVCIPCKGAYEEQDELFVGRHPKRRTIEGHLDCDSDEEPKRRATPKILAGGRANVVADTFCDARNIGGPMNTSQDASKLCNRVLRISR